LAKALGNLLVNNKKTMATAESCTGGNIAQLITINPGSSAYYKGSVISYDNAVKQNILKVSPQTLQAHGAVSEQTVIEMLTGVLDVVGADYALAVSGIMGPDGGSADKPVGLVWIAAGTADKHVTKQFNFRFDRARNIEFTSLNALNLLRKFITGQP
jgi:nicotinamide-nucleotide amidase